MLCTCDAGGHTRVPRGGLWVKVPCQHQQPANRPRYIANKVPCSNKYSFLFIPFLEFKKQTLHTRQKAWGQSLELWPHLFLTPQNSSASHSQVAKAATWTVRATQQKNIFNDEPLILKGVSRALINMILRSRTCVGIGADTLVVDAISFNQHQDGATSLWNHFRLKKRWKCFHTKDDHLESVLVLLGYCQRRARHSGYFQSQTRCIYI